MAAQKKAQVAVIGGGLSGLTVAACLERAGVSTVVIEAQSEWGGLAKGADERGFALDYGLKSIPAGDDIRSNALVTLKNELDLSFGIESWNDVPKTLQGSGTTVDFVGFGDSHNRELVEALGYYTRTPRLTVSGGWKNLINGLLENVPEKRRMPKSIVTALEVSDDRVTGAVINGETTIKADNFIFTLSPAHLQTLLPQGAVSGKILQRLARTTPLTAISLDIVTAQKVTSDKNLFVFSEPGKEKGEDPFYVIGQFVSNVDPLKQSPQGQLSTWLTLVDPETIEDDESGSKILKTMRKLIKKAFPQLIDEKNWERILVVPQAIGHFSQLTLEENGTLPGLDNLWICGAQVPFGTADATRDVSAALESALFTARQVVRHLNTAEVTAEETSAQAADQPGESPGI